jgi:hypothetical protein
MATIAEPTIRERFGTLLADAHATIVAAKANGDADTVERLARLYERCARYLEAHAARQDAYEAFHAAELAFQAESHPPYGHQDQVLTARMLIERGVPMLPLDAFDTERDADELRAGADMYRELAAMCSAKAVKGRR